MKKMIRCAAVLLSAAIITAAVPGQEAFGANLMPGVSEEMCEGSYWSGGISEKTVSRAKIKKLNQSFLAEKDCFMYDLKAQETVIDGLALNERISKSARADADSFVDKSYDKDGNKNGADYFEPFVANTINPDAKAEQNVLYGIAVNRTTMNMFPTDMMILDDPGDYDFDNLYVTALRVNEPVLILSQSADKKYYLARSDCYTGWVNAEDIGICADRAEWLFAWDTEDKKTLVVTGWSVYTGASNTSPELSEKLLTMGTTLELAYPSEYEGTVQNRTGYHNYVVYMPVRRDDGSFAQKLALIPANEDVHVGYLKLNSKNIADVVMGTLGQPYGWGGMLKSDDCSGFIRDVYRCFGLNLPRNTTWQKAMPVKSYDLADMSDEEKLEIIKKLPLGSTMYFPGHGMMLLGVKDDKVYVISSVSSVMDPEKEGKRMRLRGVVINTLDIKRANGNTWLTSLDKAVVPYKAA